MALPPQTVTALDKPPTRHEKKQDDSNKNQIFHFQTPPGFSREYDLFSFLYFNPPQVISISKRPGKLSRKDQFCGNYPIQKGIHEH